MSEKTDVKAKSEKKINQAVVSANPPPICTCEERATSPCAVHTATNWMAKFHGMD